MLELKKSFWWRVNRIRLHFNKVVFGRGCVINGYFYLKKHSESQMIFGDYFYYSSGRGINPLCVNVRGCICTEKNASIFIGNHVSCSSTVIWASKRIHIGNNCSIGGGCIIIDSDEHSLNYIDRQALKTDMLNKKSKDVVIGDDVLIGARCIILKGVHIGSRSVIGAGSVVTKDIPEDCIAAGNPAKIIRYINC